MAVIGITNDVGSATIIFSGVADSKTKLLEEQFGVAFAGRKNDYWFHPAVDFSADPEKLINDFVEQLEKRIDERVLVNTNLNFQFLFYEDAMSLDSKRMQALLRFHQGICRQIYNHGSIIRSALFVLKEKQNNRECMERFDEIYEAVLANKELKLFLVDTRPMSGIYGPIRATVRYAYIMSRANSALSSEVATAVSNANFVFSLTMSQYDVQENEALIERKQQLNTLLIGTIPDEGLIEVLKSSFRGFVEQERERLVGHAAAFGRQAPIPKKAVGGFFYWLRRKALAREIESYKNTIEMNYEKSVYPGFLEAEQPNIDSFCREIVHDDRIPFASKELIPDLFTKIRPENGDGNVPHPTNRILPCRGIETLRNAVVSTYRNMAMNDTRLDMNLYAAVSGSLGKYIEVKALQDERQKLSEELHKIENQLLSMGGANDPQEYVMDSSSITNSLRPYNGIGFSQTAEWLLISNEMAHVWDTKYQPYYAKDAYDCGTLDVQEFELLRIDGYSPERFAEGKRSFFRI